MPRVIDLRKKAESSPQSQVEEKKETSPVTEKALLVEQTIKKGEANRFEWETPSFYYNPQKKYLALVVIALLAGAGIVLFYRIDTLTAIFLILSSLVLILYANKKPGVSEVIVSQAGVTIDGRVYYYKDLKSFWLDYDPHGLKELSLEAKKWYLPYVKISIENQNPSELRSLMINFIVEKEHEKSLVDLISRKIGL